MLILNGKEKAKTQFCGKKIHQIRLNTEAWGGGQVLGSDAMQAVFGQEEVRDSLFLQNEVPCVNDVFTGGIFCTQPGETEYSLLTQTRTHILWDKEGGQRTTVKYFIIH